MARVVSKNLFNYKLNGVKSEQVIAMEAQQKAGMEKNPEMKSLMEQVNDPSADPDVVVTSTRTMMDMMMAALAGSYKGAYEKCAHTELKVPPRDGNDHEVHVYVHTPKELMNNKSNAAYIYAHGGGVVGGKAEDFNPPLSAFAAETGVVIFNVDYRLAPETKFPKNALDYYCVLKYVHENAESLGIDPSKIAIGGESGGGYICFATMVMLAQKDESHLVKLALPTIAMIDDYAFTDPAAMTKEERETAQTMRKIWCCIAHDIDSDRSNPLLFPAKASDELLSKMPPTIIWEMEFDIFITENTRMAHRMRRAGRLLEFRVQPGMTHVSAYFPGTEAFTLNMGDIKLAFNEYLL